MISQDLTQGWPHTFKTKPGASQDAPRDGPLFLASHGSPQERPGTPEDQLTDCQGPPLETREIS